MKILAALVASAVVPEIILFPPESKGETREIEDDKGFPGG
jgi:hypothetical protein